MLEPVMLKTGTFRDGNPRYRLTEPLTFRDVTVPIGFESDLCTTFFFGLSKLIVKPDYRPARAASFVHDYLLATNDRRANDYFSEILKLNGVPRWKHWLMITFVRWWTV